MTVVDSVKRDRWARLRFSIIGPLLAAPPGPGQLRGALQHLAAKTWRDPVSGLDIAFSFPTLERWYYAAKAAGDPVAVLKDIRHYTARPKGLAELHEIDVVPNHPHSVLGLERRKHRQCKVCRTPDGAINDFVDSFHIAVRCAARLKS